MVGRVGIRLSIRRKSARLNDGLLLAAVVGAGPWFQDTITRLSMMRCVAHTHTRRVAQDRLYVFCGAMEVNNAPQTVAEVIMRRTDVVDERRLCIVVRWVGPFSHAAQRSIRRPPLVCGAEPSQPPVPSHITPLETASSLPSAHLA